VVLSLIFYHLTFRIPDDFFPSTTQAIYAKLFSSILAGFCIGISFLLVVDIIFKPPSRFERMLSKVLRRFILKPRVKPAKPRVRLVSEALPIAFVSKHKRLRGFAEKMGLSVARDVLEAGEVVSPYKLTAKYLFYDFIAFFILVPTGVALAILVHPVLLIVMATPAIPLVYPKLKLRSTVGDRRRGLEDEVPFFTVYASILQSVGLSLYNNLFSIIGRGVFRQVEKDALRAKRNVEFFFKSPVEALEELGRLHPNEKMRTFLLGYTSAWRSGRS